MKKTLLWILGIVIVVFVALLLRNIIPTASVNENDTKTEKLTTEYLKLGIIPVYYDENVEEVPNWKNGEVLDEYTEVVSMFTVTRSDSRRPWVDLVLPSSEGNGCILYSDATTPESVKAIAQLVDIEKVQAFIAIPCPTDEVAIARGKEELTLTLNTMYSAFLDGMFNGDIGGVYYWTGDETQLIHRLVEMQGVSERSVDVVPTENSWGIMIPYTWEIAEWTQETIQEQIERWNYCEVDSDCATFYASCPFGCAKAVNVQFLESAQTLIEDWRTKQAQLGNPQCEYGCVESKGVKCEMNRCVVQYENAEQVPVVLTENMVAEPDLSAFGDNCRLEEGDMVVCD